MPAPISYCHQSIQITHEETPTPKQFRCQSISQSSLPHVFLLLFFLHDDADLNHLCNTPRRNMGECQEEEEEEEEEKSNE